MKTWIGRAAVLCGLTAAACTPGPADAPWLAEGDGSLALDWAAASPTAFRGAPGNVDPSAPCSARVLFTEAFADNTTRWSLAAGWEIGPARASSDQRAGFPDPASDHTGAGDDGVAGVVLGGSPSVTAPHPQRYLTSPAVDALVSGRVTLSFWRWLNTTYRNKARVEVFDGSRWRIVYESPHDDVTESGWKRVTYDLTPYKSPSLRVRFGYSAVIAFGGAPMSGWNIDDVQISACR
ncbi:MULTISPECIES: hypothetical protein [Sorangium]|uniref:MAM domain-containing protein n=1 Tax=Sorangium cellulosum (strain So ce56) TaxID=448385 RepID=A9F8T9_SORC5|nr:hypothetical protein [Sorangium cellulosum]CAN94690.1 hypothetical protein predicted by Glimmer/Critica [Sorangium cellulosum So ce56]